MLLTVENLSLTFDKKQIFNNASFRILPNEKIGVVGNNGVGKTTLINVLCGKIIPDSGKIDFVVSVEEVTDDNYELVYYGEREYRDQKIKKYYLYERKDRIQQESENGK